METLDHGVAFILTPSSSVVHILSATKLQVNDLTVDILIPNQMKVEINIPLVSSFLTFMTHFFCVGKDSLYLIYLCNPMLAARVR